MMGGDVDASSKGAHLSSLLVHTFYWWSYFKTVSNIHSITLALCDATQIEIVLLVSSLPLMAKADRPLNAFE